MPNRYEVPRRNLIAAIVAIGALAILAASALPSAATHGPASPTTHPEQLARASFTDDVDVQMRVKLDERRTRVINVREPSDVLTMRITVDEGARFPWHTHPGPVVVSVVQGELTYVNADDCVPREYPAGTAFVDPGQGNVHTAFNSHLGETVLVATFFAVDGPPTIPVPGPEGCDPFP